MARKRKYLFSVVMCLYNVEKYLDEAISSIVNQTIGFREHIQLILVNDGSKDSSGMICRKYQEKYPNNIIVIETENRGVSNARNTGFKYVRGKYVNFADSDDKWEADAFEKVLSFFNNNDGQIDIVSCRMRYFDRINGFSNGLDYKFSQTRVIDIAKEPSCLLQHIGPTIFRTKAVKKYSFDVNLIFGEDIDYNTKVLFNKQKYGVLREAVYNYRRRSDNTALSDQYLTNPVHFVDVPKKFLMKYHDDAVRRFGNCIPYVQHMIMYDLQFRLCAPVPDGVDEAHRAEYRQIIISLLQSIDDAVITSQRYIKTEEKIFALSLKHGFNIMAQTMIRNHVVFYGNLPVFDLSYHLFIDDVSFENDTIKINGFHEYNLVKEGFEVYMHTQDGNVYPLHTHKTDAYDKIAFDGTVIRRGAAFSVSIPRRGGTPVEFVLKENETEITIINPSFYKYQIVYLNRDGVSCLKRDNITAFVQQRKVTFSKEG